MISINQTITLAMLLCDTKTEAVAVEGFIKGGM